MSSQELVATNPQQGQVAPFGPNRAGLPTHAINQGAVSVEVERAIAEAQGQMTLAKRFPRDLMTARSEIMMACKSPAFAGVAFYSKPQGGSTVTGPSIRLAEQLAQCVGNFQYGHRELSRDDKKSEVEIFVWDMEKNTYAKRQKTVMHVVDTRNGPVKMRDQTQIDQKINNVASKEMRGLILALMPKWLVEEAVVECRKTLAGDNEEPLEVRVRRMTDAFAKYGVKPSHLEKHLGHGLDKILLDELVDLMGVFNSLKDGTPASELFGETDDAPEVDATAQGLAAAAKAGTEAKAAAKPAPKATAKPAAKDDATVTKTAQNNPDVEKEQAPAVDSGTPVQTDSTQVEAGQPTVEQTNAASSETGAPAKGVDLF